MHVFYSEERRGNLLILREGEVKHFRVRRIEKDEEFGVIHEGKIYVCKVRREDKREISCEIVEELETKLPPKDITLYQSVTVDLKTMDTIVRQATELGVLTFVPIISERSFQKEEAILKKTEKWKRIVIEAMKQSRRPIPMEIKKPVRLSDLIPESEENIILDNFYEGVKPKDVNLEAKTYSVVVGPEGGFSKRESQILREKGFKSVLLEPYTLRTETAVVSIVSILMNF
ncbi:16S rRNA (uracil(1498)-N(3))-methyltransferase [Aquifex aeolicus]|uniref:Ribosomal RNA small subunit methyltransferase E n=1 Tax=Aquifex aeolicus (strain VF5) TaxID=224324 RepID=RSME_AQUAE|nr:16S rRNA (uracil(1498)-N(3))-methyltransferase [Aquifex aeolicus]O66552.1 RecName: Full=Ribosomal RNA small subunit methyltransferase E; AltName: Full=16S rRNA m3U1498 methyltransferase [Aquifex aeolicus VF5]2EGV_A Chain A, UPF0088 protein aq_165 [Aquifex aeolicus]2EGV_B Chain B, UPF0088 protein aq_165 [Aquifex aeolicus]2EGW_A Chain A, UPF0088 protein aq_165 [Aquifex aeolicus]2EGW_B Chain B, UPF0088 protein aq_165 [Aquifex aeolicus]AAC06516.1 hypothetical protein aq_165 [Aquifex aeolicus V